MGKGTERMGEYWDDRARENAAWYVDTSLAYDEPDMERFLATGEDIVRLALDEAPVAPERREVALEIGPGLGRIVLALRKRFPRVVGVDVSAEMLERARAFVDDPGITLLQGDGASLAGVDDESVDLVVTFTVLQHIPDPQVIGGYLREAGRVLRPGGVLAFQWNNLPGHRRWALQRALRGALFRAGLRRETRDAPQFLGSRVPLARIDDALASGGLRREALRDPGTLFTWAWARKA